MKLPVSAAPALLRPFAALLLALPAVLLPATVEERLAALEQQFEELRRENATLRAELAVRPAPPAPEVKPSGGAKPAVSPVGGSAPPVLPGGRESKLVLGGFIQFNGESGGVPDARWAGASDRFFVRRARLNLTATFAENVTARLEGAFGAEALAPRAANTVQAMDAYVQWSRGPELVLRGGQFKSPFGFEQLTSDLKGFLIERSLPNDRLTIGRQIGVGASGEVASRRINYAVGLFNGNGTNTGANDNENFLPAARLGAVAYDGKLPGGTPVRWAVATNAFTTSDNGAFTGRRTGWGADSQLTVGHAELWAEWLRQELRPAGGSAFTTDGWSVLGAYTFTPHWQGAVRHETFDSNATLMNTTTRSWTFGVNYLLRGDDLKLSLDYVHGSPPAPAVDGGRWLGRMQVIF